MTTGCHDTGISENKLRTERPTPVEIVSRGTVTHLVNDDDNTLNKGTKFQLFLQIVWDTWEYITCTHILHLFKLR